MVKKADFDKLPVPGKGGGKGGKRGTSPKPKGKAKAKAEPKTPLTDEQKAKIPCKGWGKGNCKYGAECKFEHDDAKFGKAKKKGPE